MLGPLPCSEERPGGCHTEVGTKLAFQSGMWICLVEGKGVACNSHGKPRKGQEPRPSECVAVARTRFQPARQMGISPVEHHPFLGNSSTITVNNVVMGSYMVPENLGPFLTCIWSFPAGPGNATAFIILIFRRLRQRGKEGHIFKASLVNNSIQKYKEGWAYSSAREHWS